MLCLTDSAAVLYWWAGCLCCTGKVAFVMIGDFRELISLLQSILILGYCCFHIQFYFGLKVNRSCVKLCPLSHLLFHKHNTHSSTALIKLYVHCTTDYMNEKTAKMPSLCNVALPDLPETSGQVHENKSQKLP